MVTSVPSEMNLGALPAVYMLAGIAGYVLGGLLFGIATFRAGILPRWAGGLLALGAILPLLLSSLVHHPYDRLFAVPVGLAMAWLGYALWSERREPAAQPLPGSASPSFAQPQPSKVAGNGMAWTSGHTAACRMVPRSSPFQSPSVVMTRITWPARFETRGATHTARRPSVQGAEYERNVSDQGRVPDVPQRNAGGQPTPQKPKAPAKAGSAAWLVPAGLILLSAIPLAAGTFRLTQLAGGAEITPANARFFASPLPVVLHIVGVAVYVILGAFQFVPSLRSGATGWHRVAGRIVIPCGLLVALSGLWMTLFYPWPEGDGAMLYGLRLLFGSAMLVSIRPRLRRDPATGLCPARDWMLRGYAIGHGRWHAGADPVGRGNDRRPAERAQPSDADGRGLGDQPGRGRMDHPPGGHLGQPRQPARHQPLYCSSRESVMMPKIAAWLYPIVAAGLILFQLALAAGAPWGEFAMGGAFPGQFPLTLRVVAVIQAAVIVGMVTVVLARVGIFFTGWVRRTRWLIWVVVGYGVIWSHPQPDHNQHQ